MSLFRMSLALQMAIATALGILMGLFLGDICRVFAPWTAAYVMILKVTILPYLIGAILHGIGSLTSGQAKKILKKGMLFICIAWTINLGVVYLIKLAFPHPEGGNKAGFISGKSASINFAELLIPENIFNSLANNIVPSVVIFSLLIGIALMHVKRKEVMMGSLETLVEALTRVTSWISRITPIGTFLIMAQQVGTIQVSTMKQVSTYLILYILGTCLVIFWIFPKLVSTLTQLSPLRWIKLLSPVLLLAYTTNVVIVCLPYIMEIVHRETSALYPKDEKAQDPIQGIVSVVFNMPMASLFLMVFIFFCSLFYQVPLTLSSQIKLLLTTFLTSLGAIGLGALLNSLNFILDTLSMPLEAINLYLTTLPFVSGFQSMVSAMEIASLSLFITLACRNLIRWKWRKIAHFSFAAIAPVFLLFGMIKIFNPLPPIQRIAKTIYDLNIQSNVKVTVYADSNADTLSERLPGGDLLEQIERSGVLRVGYDAQLPPFSFINSDGKIVGFDIIFAYELAHDLGCDLEFVPLHYPLLAEELNRGVYDIGMSAISITTERLRSICFTKPYMESKVVLIFKSTHRKKFTSLRAIDEGKEVRIAVRRGSAYESHAKEIFPDKELILLNSYEEFAHCSAKDLLLWEEQEAIAWVLSHPDFTILFTKVPIGTETLGYAVKAGEERFLCYLNQWMTLKKSQGFSEQMYKLWILGQTEIIEAPPPRWSVIHNVLHWTKPPKPIKKS